MSPMRLIILAVALIAAVAAAFLVRNMANQQPTVVTGPTQTVEKIVEVEVSQQKVLVAKGDLRVGTLLTPDDFKWANWPEETVNPAYFTQDFAPDAMEIFEKVRAARAQALMKDAKKKSAAFEVI